MSTASAPAGGVHRSVRINGVYSASSAFSAHLSPTWRMVQFFRPIEWVSERSSKCLRVDEADQAQPSMPEAKVSGLQAKLKQLEDG